MFGFVALTERAAVTDSAESGQAFATVVRFSDVIVAIAVVAVPRCAAVAVGVTVACMARPDVCIAFGSLMVTQALM